MRNPFKKKSAADGYIEGFTQGFNEGREYAINQFGAFSLKDEIYNIIAHYVIFEDNVFKELDRGRRIRMIQNFIQQEVDRLNKQYVDSDKGNKI